MIPLDTPFYLTYCWVIFSALAYSLWRDLEWGVVEVYVSWDYDWEYIRP